MIKAHGGTAPRSASVFAMPETELSSIFNQITETDYFLRYKTLIVDSYVNLIFLTSILLSCHSINVFLLKI